MYDGNMHYANLPYCVTNLHNYLLSGISIFQILFLILASFKALSSFSYVSSIPRTETTKRSQAATFLYICDLFKFLTFCHWWSRNLLFCKGESEVPRFFISYSVYIRAELCPSKYFGQVSHIRICIHICVHEPSLLFFHFSFFCIFVISLQRYKYIWP